MKRTRIRIPAVIAALLVATAIPLSSLAQKPPLLPDQTVSALSNELSGEIAKRNLEGITRFHRQRGSQGFHSAAEIILERARATALPTRKFSSFPPTEKSITARNARVRRGTPNSSNSGKSNASGFIHQTSRFWEMDGVPRENSQATKPNPSRSPKTAKAPMSQRI
jgi:hypothetical protein